MYELQNFNFVIDVIDFLLEEKSSVRNHTECKKTKQKSFPLEKYDWLIQ